ncbi:hypothetical protein V492_04426 [Pseudogymnoascus sp. VKM F-4246]|nr:hypothetical protein V492_04426 [Pseudogymnoascus sp. VKM F-4246]
MSPASLALHLLLPIVLTTSNIIDALDEYDELEDIPKADLCSYCYGAKLSLMQESEFSAYDQYFAATFEMFYGQSHNSNQGAARIQRFIARRFVAVANSISGATLYYINEDLPNCTAIKAGLELYLPQSCITHTITADETCADLAMDVGTSVKSLVDWNLMLDSRCINLWAIDPFWGRVICISSPGSDFGDGGSGGDGSNPGNGDIGGEGGSGNGYADIIVDPPVGKIGEGTTNKCGIYVQAQEGVGCAKMIVGANRSTPIDLFLEVNPFLESAVKCDSNLVPTMWYCLSPVYGWEKMPEAPALSGPRPA